MKTHRGREGERWRREGKGEEVSKEGMGGRDKWEFCRKSGKEKRSKVFAKEKLDKEEVREEYKRKLSERLRGTRMRVGEEMSVNYVYDVFKSTVTEVANEVVGWRERKGRKKEMHGGQMKVRMQ